jgi:hypothetical protein
MYNLAVARYLPTCFGAPNWSLGTSGICYKSRESINLWQEGHELA